MRAKWIGCWRWIVAPGWAGKRFLTRLAGQRLLVARDIDAALSLLRQADDLLRDTGNLGSNQRALRLPEIAQRWLLCQESIRIGLYAQLSALIEQMDSLQIAFERETPPVPQADTAGEGLWEGVSARWQAALATLSDHLVIRHRSDEIAQLMTPEWAALARQNGQMLLEQAQIAMLSANQPLYEQSLARARDFVSVFREQDVDRVAGILEEIAQLEQAAVSPDLPDLIESRSLLEAQIERLGREASG